jgi:hypothetical protein
MSDERGASKRKEEQDAKTSATVHCQYAVGPTNTRNACTETASRYLQDSDFDDKLLGHLTHTINVACEDVCR